MYFCFQDPKKANFENWFDINEVVSNKRGQIAQIIRETFPEKNFPIFSIASTVTAKDQWPDSSIPKSHLLELAQHEFVHVPTASQTVTVPVSQTIQIQVDIVSSPSYEIINEFEETPSISDCHEGSALTNKHVRKSNVFVVLG